MSALRKVRFGVANYWHVVDDDTVDHEIIGSLLYNPHEKPLEWRAEYAPLSATSGNFAVGHFKTEEEAIKFLEQKAAENK